MGRPEAGDPGDADSTARRRTSVARASRSPASQPSVRQKATILNALYLERKGSRGPLFYEARLERSGPEWRLVRRWGYAGRRGWRRVDLFDGEEEARLTLERLARRRLREGYQPGPGAQLPLLSG